MLRFLTDELQEAEDAGERGKHKRPGLLSSCAVLTPRSMDFGARPNRLGRHEPFVEPN